MARGWDSKAIEDQISDAEAAKALREQRVLTQNQRVALGRQTSLLHTKAQVLERLTASRDDRYSAQLRLALAHVNAQLAEIDVSPDAGSSSDPDGEPESG